MSPLACLAALLSALLYFLAFSRPPAPVGSEEGSMVMPVKSLHTLLLAGAGAAAPAGAVANASPVAETAPTHRTRMNLRILWNSLLEDVHRMTAWAPWSLSSDYSFPRLWCPGRDSNPHAPEGAEHFKCPAYRQFRHPGANENA